jgi:hypothetical protein
LLLDGVVSAAADWDKAEAARKPDFLAHRGSRLADAQALAARRGPDWEPAIAPARAYLAAWQAREAAEREEKEATLTPLGSPMRTNNPSPGRTAVFATLPSRLKMKKRVGACFWSTLG